MKLTNEQRDQLSSFVKEAEEIQDLLWKYEAKAKEFDKKWNDWAESTGLFGDKKRIHPCQIVAATLTAEK